MNTHKDIQSLSDEQIIEALTPHIDSYPSTKAGETSFWITQPELIAFVRAILASRQPAPEGSQQGEGVVDEPFLIFANRQPINVAEHYARIHNMALPNTPSMNGREIKAAVGAEMSYQLFLENSENRPDGSVGDSEGVALVRGMRFYAVPPATWASDAAHPPADAAPVDAKPELAEAGDTTFDGIFTQRLNEHQATIYNALKAAGRPMLPLTKAAQPSPAQGDGTIKGKQPSVSDPDCNYMMTAGRVCHKCGRVHRGMGGGHV